MKLVCFEGGIGAGKTTLTNYFSHQLNCGKLLEDYEANPFLQNFYKEKKVDFETEMTFLMIHFYQLKDAITNCKNNLIIADFSIEKDLVFAQMNLNGRELEIFISTYEYIIDQVGYPDIVFYLELSPEILKKRLRQRGRIYEIDADKNYFEKYNNNNRKFFFENSRSQVIPLNADYLELDPDKITK
jgi:deoxyguanosine kinase